MGLRGTGSNDILVRNLFVPEEQTFSFQDPALLMPRHCTCSRTCSLPGPAAALGIARHVVDALIESATTRPARRYTLGDRLEAPKVLRDEVFVQEAAGRADTLLASVRAYYLDEMGTLWETLVAGKPPSNERNWPDSPMAHAHIIGVCVEVVQLAFQAAGGTAVYAKGPSRRCLRDIRNGIKRARGGYAAHL